MEQTIPDMLLELARLLFWLGKHREANALTLLSRWLRARGIETLEKLEYATTAVERDAEKKP